MRLLIALAAVWMALALGSGAVLAFAPDRSVPETAGRGIRDRGTTGQPAGRGPAESARTLVVSPAGPYFTIDAALAEAQPGDTVEVHGGHYAGPLVVSVEGVFLEGHDWPVIDGGGQGTVVTLAAPGIVFRGFEVRGSGVEPDRDHAGISLAAPGIVVENNRLRDVLFGIFVAQADEALLRGNDIGGKAQYDLGRKGDGIRVWESQRVVVEQNHVRATRDVVLYYAEDVIVRENVIERGRYGVHLMYCDGAQIERNQLLDNSVGVYVMYSNRIDMRDNLIRGQRGPSGYALGFKDAGDVEAAGNVLVDNRVGIFLDGTPFSPQAYGRFHDNILAFNDVGVALLPAVRGAAFEDNTLWDNVEQMAIQGGGLPGENTWLGNYWSDYSGYDADGDGRGDLPYRSERLFENMTDRAPMLRALLYSPAAQAIEFTASALPVVRPQPKLTDAAPRMQPAALPPVAQPQRQASGGVMGLSAAALSGIGVLSMWMALRSPKWERKPHREDAKNAKSLKNFAPFASRRQGAQRSRFNSDSIVIDTTAPALSVQQVSKRYGRATVLDGVSFEARPGQALALWGANGAGKTTLLKAILGLVQFDGQIVVGGHDVRRSGKNARQGIGYVPQEAAFYDLSVQATMEFHARLKKVSPALIPALLDRLGLADHARKRVQALSGGLKQRLALALALLADPPVLLLDEPTASLDAQAQADYVALLKQLRDEEHKTIVFASHRLEEVEALATQVLGLEAGRVVEGLPRGLARTAPPAPQIDLALWVPEEQRPLALACLTEVGATARLNGRGTIVVQAQAGSKLRPMQALQAHGILVHDLEIE
jgi:nitrous oxidase accessory protein